MKVINEYTSKKGRRHACYVDGTLFIYRRDEQTMYTKRLDSRFNARSYKSLAGKLALCNGWTLPQGVSAAFANNDGDLGKVIRHLRRRVVDNKAVLLGSNRRLAEVFEIA